MTEVVQLSLRGADVRALVVHVVMRGASATLFKSGRPARPPLDFSPYLQDL